MSEIRKIIIKLIKMHTVITIITHLLLKIIKIRLKSKILIYKNKDFWKINNLVIIPITILRI